MDRCQISICKYENNQVSAGQRPKATRNMAVTQRGSRPLMTLKALPQPASDSKWRFPSRLCFCNQLTQRAFRCSLETSFPSPTKSNGTHCHIFFFSIFNSLTKQYDHVFTLQIFLVYTHPIQFFGTHNPNNQLLYFNTIIKYLYTMKFIFVVC